MHGYYTQYCEKRDYLWKYSLEKDKIEQSVVPFEIWVELTKKGKDEINKPEYTQYCEEK